MHLSLGLFFKQNKIPTPRVNRVKLTHIHLTINYVYQNLGHLTIFKEPMVLTILNLIFQTNSFIRLDKSTLLYNYAFIFLFILKKVVLSVYKSCDLPDYYRLWDVEMRWKILPDNTFYEANSYEFLFKRDYYSHSMIFNRDEQ